MGLVLFTYIFHKIGPNVGKVYQSHGPFFRVVLLTMAAFGEVNDLSQRLAELSQDVQDGSWKG